MWPWRATNEENSGGLSNGELNHAATQWLQEWSGTYASDFQRVHDDAQKVLDNQFFRISGDGRLLIRRGDNKDGNPFFATFDDIETYDANDLYVWGTEDD